MADRGVHDVEKGEATSRGTDTAASTRGPMVSNDRNGAGPSGTGAVGGAAAGTGAGSYTRRPSRIAEPGAL